VPCYGQVLAHADINATSAQRGGVDPGTWLRVTSTQTTVHAAVTHSAAASVLMAASEWSAALGAGSGAGGGVGGAEAEWQRRRMAEQQALVAASSSGHRMVVQMENLLGPDVVVAVDDGTATQVRAGPRMSKAGFFMPLAKHAVQPVRWTDIQTLRLGPRLC
jgi:hypothetical protein